MYKFLSFLIDTVMPDSINHLDFSDSDEDSDESEDEEITEKGNCCILETIVLSF